MHAGHEIRVPKGFAWLFGDPFFDPADSAAITLFGIRPEGQALAVFSDLRPKTGQEIDHLQVAEGLVDVSCAARLETAGTVAG